MAQKGIYILANDVVLDQLIALVNSIEVNAGKDYPICVLPYDDRLDQTREYIHQNQRLSLLDDPAIISRWDNWVEAIWQLHPTAAQRWFDATGKTGVHRMGTHRRFCAFEGPFEQFIYMDSDTLLLDSPQKIFDALQEVDWVTYDFQHKDPSHVFDIHSPKLEALFSQEKIHAQIFCSGFYGTKRHVITADDISFYMEQLASGEAEVLYPFAPDQTILNYFVLRKPISSINLALHLPSKEVTGNSVTSPHFEPQANHLVDKGVRLTYLHYIGIPAKCFTQVCQGENIDFPYREIFLHYRYLHEPEKMPKFKGKPISYKPQPPSLLGKIGKKLGFAKSAK